MGAKMAGLSIGVEPSPDNFKTLSKNKELNRLENIKLLQNAVFSKKKKIPFYVGDSPDGCSIFVASAKKINVDAITLDDIVKDLKLKRVDLIKVDTELAELDVLKGAKKTIEKFKPKFVLEVQDELIKDCKKYLKGYKIWRLNALNVAAVPIKQ